MFYPERAHGVEHGEDHDADVGEDGEGHAHYAQRAEDEEGELDAYGKGDVGAHDAHAAAGEPDQENMDLWREIWYTRLEIL